MNIYDTNMNPIRKKHYGHKLLRYYVNITLQKKSEKITQSHTSRGAGWTQL